MLKTEEAMYADMYAEMYAEEISAAECRGREKELAGRRRKAEFRARDRKKKICSLDEYLGPYYEKNGHIGSLNISRKYYKRVGNKKVRAYCKGLSKGSQYKKIYDVWWDTY